MELKTLIKPEMLLVVCLCVPHPNFHKFNPIDIAQSVTSVIFIKLSNRHWIFPTIALPQWSTHTHTYGYHKRDNGISDARKSKTVTYSVYGAH